MHVLRVLAGSECNTHANQNTRLHSTHSVKVRIGLPTRVHAQVFALPALLQTYTLAISFSKSVEWA